MSIPRSWTRFLSVFLTECVVLLVKIDAQSLEITTGECIRFIGSQMEMIGKYNSLPGNPTEWQRPDITTIGTCRPNVSCTPFLSGYKLYYNNSGLDYTLLITAASPTDEGLWQLTDGVTSLSTSLTFAANLTAVNVNCAAINTSTGYTESVTCTTDCVKDAIGISYNLSANLPSPQTNINTTGCPTGARYSSTIPLDNNLHSGISELCYILSSGNCNHTQTDHCISVVIQPTTTTIPPTTTTTVDLNSNDCNTTTAAHVLVLPEPECGLIAVLVLAGLLAFGCITFLGILIKRGPKGSCRKGIIAILGITALVGVVVIILVVLDLNDLCFQIKCAEESESASRISGLGISGSVLFALAGVAFIVALIIYCKEGENTEEPKNDVHMSTTNGAPCAS